MPLATQDWIVLGIVGCAASYLARVIWKALRARQGGACGSCGSCPSNSNQHAPQVVSLGGLSGQSLPERHPG